MRITTLAFLGLLCGCGGSSPSKDAPDLSGPVAATQADLSVADLALADFASAAGGDFAAAAGADLAATGGGDLAHAISFQQDVMPILSSNGCLSHHMTTAWNGVESASGSAAIIAYLTSTSSSQCGSDKFVAAGSATKSYLYQKVSGSFAAPCASSDTMPLGSGPLPVAQSGTIKAWIEAGAPNN